MYFLLAPQVLESLLEFWTKWHPSLRTSIIHMWVLLSQHKQLQTRPNESLMETWRRKERVFMAHLLAKMQSFSLMILTCLRRKNSVPNHQLSFSVSGWTIKDGMTSTLLRKISGKSWTQHLPQPCILPLVEMEFPTDTYATSMCVTFLLTQMVHCNTSSAMSCNGFSKIRPRINTQKL